MDHDGSGAGEELLLVRRAQTGDRAAFAELILRYRPALRRLLYRMTRSVDDADDLSQETFLRAYQGLRELERAEAFRSWLFRIASNLALNHVAKRRTAGQRDTDGVEELSAAANQADDLERLQIHALVRNGVDRLPPRQRLTLLMRIETDLPFKEIAAAMGCAEGTAKANYFHAVRALSQLLAPLAREGVAGGDTGDARSAEGN
ncbi:MAG: sigma-70 family RNA polymerase sigma factor [Candidatus Schekmanbacteria bacterium]|nr:sigma-70 family RNA polymerase sigma factor [Candidatus Schekmanbacteria bacterium]